MDEKRFYIQTGGAMKKLIIVTIVSIFFIGCADKSTSTSFLGIEWVKIPAGEFQMGSNEYGNERVHAVYLDIYYISKYEVTFAQYDAFCKATSRRKPDDRSWGRGSRPVIDVSWHDAFAFCKWYSEKTGKNVHLLTEAQWEKACRAGSSDRWYGNIDDIAWYVNNSGDYRHPTFMTLGQGCKTRPVGQKQPNRYGLYDMVGNAHKWCSDWYDPKYYSNSPYRNPSGPSSGSYRVMRGGSILTAPLFMRAANRYAEFPFNRGKKLGKHRVVFRLAYGFRLAMD
jgi:sulfatase modifying factor 1